MPTPDACLRLSTAGDGLAFAGGRLRVYRARSAARPPAPSSTPPPPLRHLETRTRQRHISVERHPNGVVRRGSGDTVSLWPLPGMSDLRHHISVLLFGEIVRLALGWVDHQAPAVIGPLLDVLGLRDNPARLFRGPAAVLAALPPRLDGQPGLSMQAVDQLLGAAKAFVAPQATGDESPYPGDWR